MRHFNLKDLSKEKITAAVFLIIIFGMLAMTVISIRPIASELLSSYRNSISQDSTPFQKVKTIIGSTDGALGNGLKGRNLFIELYGSAQMAMGKQIVNDASYGALYKTPYGQTTFAVGYKDVSDELARIISLKKQLDKEGIPFLYIQAPFKLPPNEIQIPVTAADYSNKNADDFLEGLDAAGVDYFDLRPGFWSSGMSQNELFFDTDHHWTINGAFYSFGQIVEKLNKEYGFSIDPQFTDIVHYKQKQYEDFYIGSMGRRVGRIYGGVDDFTLITPDFDTKYTLYERDYGGEVIYEGSFEEAVLSKHYIDEDAPLVTNRYAVYHGDNRELEFVNHNIDEGSVLMIKDSFGLPVYSFLSLTVHEIRALDMRLFKDSVLEYAVDHKPDIVIIMYNADVFGGGMFDFEAR